MRPEIVAVLVGGGLAGGAAGLYVGRRFAFVARRGRVGLAVAAALLVALGAMRSLLEVRGMGTWRCSICCAAREELRFAELGVWTGEARDDEDSLELARRFREWFHQGGGAHRHDWQPIGCHTRGWLSIACAPRLDEYYRALLLVPDEGFARSVHARVVALEPGERSRRLRRWAPRLGELLLERELAPGLPAQVQETLRELCAESW